MSDLNFDLGRGVSLAFCAFKAYCDPKPVHAFTDFDVDETTVMILDKEFLGKAYWGVLEVQLLEASGLTHGVPGEMLGKPNTYAVVSLVSPKDLDARTRPLRFTSMDVSDSPTWDSRKPPMLFPVRARPMEEDNVELRIELYDDAPSTHRPYRNMHLLGFTTLPLHDLLLAKEKQEKVGQTEQEGQTCQDCWITHALELTRPSNGGSVRGGIISVNCRLRPMAQANPAHLDAIVCAKTLDMSWDAPMQVGLDVVEWLRRSAYEKVTWQYLVDVMEAAGGKVGKLRPLAFIECRRTKTEAWLWYNLEDRRVVVAFRGTNESGDWLYDLAVLPVPEKEIRDPAEPAGNWDANKIRVHKGFLDAYTSVRTAVLRLVGAVMDMSPSAHTESQEPSWRVEVTGHSLGGALATLGAYDLAWRQRLGDPRLPRWRSMKVGMVTFGEPRVGNTVFAKDFNFVLPDAWRVHNTNDVVTSVPFTFGFLNFTHVGKDVRMGRDGLPTATNHEVERWLPLKLLSTTPISSHLEFRYQDTMLQMVRRWVQLKVQLQWGNCNCVGSVVAPAASAAPMKPKCS